MKKSLIALAFGTFALGMAEIRHDEHSALRGPVHAMQHPRSRTSHLGLRHRCLRGCPFCGISSP